MTHAPRPKLHAIAIGALALLLSSPASATEPCLALDDAPNGLTIAYASGSRLVVTGGEDAQSRIDNYASDGSLIDANFTIAGAFVEETIAGDGRPLVAIERKPDPATLLPFVPGESHSLRATFRRPGERAFALPVTVSVIEKQTVELPEAGCSLDLALLRFDMPGAAGATTRFAVNAPALRANVVSNPPARLSDIDPRNLPVAIRENDRPLQNAAAIFLAVLKAQRPAWLPTLETCPYDAFPARPVGTDYYPQRCAARPAECLQACKDGDANECFAAAIAFQRVDNSEISEALFQRACRQGLVLGCVNRAAGMSDAENACKARTFDAACQEDDVWGCTMSGLHLADGLGVDADADKARAALQRACAISSESRPCEIAREWLEELTP